MKLAIYFALFALSACNSTTKIKDIKPLTNQNSILNSPEEQRVFKKSADLHAKFLKKGLIVRNKEANEYVQSIAKELEPSFEHPDIELNYFILKDANINASAMPNGNIYLNAGLISKLQNEDQLAFVIAHEIAHVIHRHGLKKHIDSKNTIASSHVANLFLMGTNLIYFATMSDLASFSRESERDADLEAMNYIANSRYNLSEGKKAIQLLRQVKYVKEETSAWSTHESITSRTKIFDAMAKKYDWDIVVTNEYDEKYQRLREPIAEHVVKIRMRAKMYELAAELVEQELALSPEDPQWHFFQGEVNRLRAYDQEAYAKEYAWLHDLDNDADLHSKLSKNSDSFAKAAKKSYDTALSLDASFLISYRGLGLLALKKNEHEIAKMMFEKYLKAEGIYDRRYIESIKDSI